METGSNESEATLKKLFVYMDTFLSDFPFRHSISTRISEILRKKFESDLDLDDAESMCKSILKIMENEIKNIVVTLTQFDDRIVAFNRQNGHQLQSIHESIIEFQMKYDHFNISTISVIGKNKLALKKQTLADFKTDKYIDLSVEDMWGSETVKRGDTVNPSSRPNIETCPNDTESFEFDLTCYRNIEVPARKDGEPIDKQYLFEKMGLFSRNVKPEDLENTEIINGDRALDSSTPLSKDLENTEIINGDRALDSSTPLSKDSDQRNEFENIIQETELFPSEPKPLDADQENNIEKIIQETELFPRDPEPLDDEEAELYDVLKEVKVEEILNSSLDENFSCKRKKADVQLLYQELTKDSYSMSDESSSLSDVKSTDLDELLDLHINAVQVSDISSNAEDVNAALEVEKNTKHFETDLAIANNERKIIEPYRTDLPIVLLERIPDDTCVLLEKNPDITSLTTELNEAITLNRSSSDTPNIGTDTENVIKSSTDTACESPSTNKDYLDEKFGQTALVNLTRCDAEELLTIPRKKVKRSDSIDRLCDMNSLEALRRKRAHSSASEAGTEVNSNSDSDTTDPEKPAEKRPKMSRSSSRSSLLSFSNSFSSNLHLSDFSDSEPPPDDGQKEEVCLDPPLPLEKKDEDDLFARVILNDIQDMSDREVSSEDSFESSDEEKNKVKKKQRGDKPNEEKKSDSGSEESQDEENTEQSDTITAANSGSDTVSEDLLKKAWKSDPLLKDKILSDSDTDKSTKRVSRYERDDEDFEPESASTKKSPTKPPTISPGKKSTAEQETLSEISDSSTGVEFLSPTRRKSSNDPLDLVNASPSKGRRNIRSLVSEENLEASTQKAKSQEMERIKRLSQKLKRMSELTNGSLETNNQEGMILDYDEVTGEPLIRVNKNLSDRLKDHQVDGVQFMFECCFEGVKAIKENEGTGCILAHCMGLGKTFQVITLLHTLFHYHTLTKTQHVLIVCPLSTIFNWKKEFKIAFDCAGDTSFHIYSIATTKDRTRKYEIIRKWHKGTGVLVMGYESFEKTIKEKSLDKLSPRERNMVYRSLVDPGPDLVVCDEGHLLRSRNALRTQALMQIRTPRRIVLTGTPMQNNLIEYYYMVQFVKPNLLGTLKEYTTNFANPISNGQYIDSTSHDIRLMKNRTHVLHELLNNTIQRIESSVLKSYLPKITDYAIFIRLHKIQGELYKEYVDTALKRGIKKKHCFFKDYRVLSNVTCHPYILSILKKKKENPNVVLIKETDIAVSNDDLQDVTPDEEWWKNIVSDEEIKLLDVGTKLIVLRQILVEASKAKDKTLVFSQSLGELDCIEYFLKNFGTSDCPNWVPNVDYMRMDGTVSPDLRGNMCDSFNDTKNEKLRLFLISHKVGGLGLNLTAANRVVLLGVNFNPSYDSQSVYRVYRFGQNKHCVIYRLITLGTMEEKMYNRGVNKLAVSSRVVDKHQIRRHYSVNDLSEMYEFDLCLDKERPLPNVPEDTILAKLISTFPCIYKYHEHQGLLENRPEEELNEDEKQVAWDEFKKINEPPPPIPPQLPLPDLNELQAHLQGKFQGPLQGPLQGTHQGTLQRPLQIPLQGPLQGPPQGLLQGKLQEQKGQTQGPLQGQLQNALSGQVQGQNKVHTVPYITDIPRHIYNTIASKIATTPSLNAQEILTSAMRTAQNNYLLNTRQPVPSTSKDNGNDSPKVNKDSTNFNQNYLFNTIQPVPSTSKDNGNENDSPKINNDLTNCNQKLKIKYKKIKSNLLGSITIEDDTEVMEIDDNSRENPNKKDSLNLSTSVENDEQNSKQIGGDATPSNDVLEINNYVTNKDISEVYDVDEVGQDDDVVEVNSDGIAVNKNVVNVYNDVVESDSEVVNEDVVEVNLSDPLELNKNPKVNNNNFLSSDVKSLKKGPVRRRVGDKLTNRRVKDQDVEVVKDKNDCIQIDDNSNDNESDNILITDSEPEDKIANEGANALQRALDVLHTSGVSVTLGKVPQKKKKRRKLKYTADTITLE